MLLDMREDKDNIVAVCGKENIGCSIYPSVEIPACEHLVLNLINDGIRILGDMPVQGSKQFELPGIELHP